MLQCSGTAKLTGLRCKREGEANVGHLFYCRDHLKCKGFKDEGQQLRCGSRGNLSYDGYCGAAHHPHYNFFKPIQFRGEDLPVTVNELLRSYDSTDAYTGAALKAKRTQRDHIVECQIPAHVLNMLRREYIDRGRRGITELRNVIPIVKEFVNDQKNLIPIDQDINVLKGAGVKSFLDERTFFDKDALWTTSLLEAHDQINCGRIQEMKKNHLGRRTTKRITKEMTKGLKRMERKLEDERDNKAVGRLAKNFKKLRVQIKNT
ncbi:hypothetical protein V7S43_006043 [Phytophthora oleae]|uniref:Uncharacterized protein n=1 Tax=Phytophthora oleae TaxID=2107226 RepID=A0ABD3FPE9_9STRA